MLFKKIAATIFIALLCVMSVLVGQQLLPKNHPVVIEEKYRARSKGNPKADYWIIEYLDFQCSSCHMGFQLTEALLKEKPKEVFLQARYYPLIQHHLYALKSSIYADCAAQQGKYWEMAGQIFETQRQWASSKDPDAFFISTAASLGIDVKKLTACVEDPKTKEAVLAERAQGQALGITRTPTFFVNGNKLEGVQAMAIDAENYFSKKESERAG